jgi:hypothetical protein
MLAGYTCVNSLFKFDPEALVWTELTESAAGLRPVSRNWPANVVYNGRLYLFGGIRLTSLQGVVSLIQLTTESCHKLARTR